MAAQLNAHKHEETHRVLKMWCTSMHWLHVWCVYFE